MKKKSVKLSSMQCILALLQKLQMNLFGKLVCSVSSYPFGEGNGQLMLTSIYMYVSCPKMDTEGKTFSFRIYEKSKWNATYNDLLEFINTQINNGKD